MVAARSKSGFLLHVLLRGTGSTLRSDSTVHVCIIAIKQSILSKFAQLDFLLTLSPVTIPEYLYKSRT